jgi:hypothetical protein
MCCFRRWNVEFEHHRKAGKNALDAGDWSAPHLSRVFNRTSLEFPPCHRSDDSMGNMLSQCYSYRRASIGSNRLARRAG